MQPEFEAVFRVYDEAVQFMYLKSFLRVRVLYSTEEQAQLAQDNLNNHIFDGDSLKLRPIKVGRIISQNPPRKENTLLGVPEKQST